MPDQNITARPQRIARLAAVMGSILSVPAHAGPPFVTDDPEPAEYRKWEVNYAISGTRNLGQPFTPLPQIDINYGAAPGLQLHVQPQMSHLSTQEGVRDYVLSGTELGVKYVLAESESWMASLYPLYELPIGNNANVGIGSPSLYLPIWLQTAKDRWTFFGGGGYWINSGSGNRNAWAGGVAALYQFTTTLQLGAELFGNTPAVIGNNNSLGFNVGGYYRLAKDYTLLFSTGRGLVNAPAANQTSLYLGIQVLY